MVKCQPFAKTHEEQIKLVCDLSWFDTGVLSGLDEEIMEVFSQSRTVGTSRARDVAEAVHQRASAIENLLRTNRQLY